MVQPCDLKMPTAQDELPGHHAVLVPQPRRLVPLAPLGRRAAEEATDAGLAPGEATRHKGRGRGRCHARPRRAISPPPTGQEADQPESAMRAAVPAT
jgi:hypothetical protein